MAYPFVQARWYTPGPRTSPINKAVIHTIERDPSIDGAEITAQWLATTDRQVSAHQVIDDDSVVACVKESDIAWAAPGANHDGIQLELANRAAADTGLWMAHRSLLLVTAASLADLYVRYSIPLHFLTGAEMLAEGPNAKGVTTHLEVNNAYHRSDHTDPGLGFPMQFVLDEARILLNQPTTEVEVPYLMIDLAPLGYSNIFACFPGGAVRAMALSEFLWYQSKQIPEVKEQTPDGMRRLLKQAGLTEADLVKL